MNYEANTPAEYVSQLPEDRKKVVENLRETIKVNLPPGFEEVISYGMVSYVIPHTIYPPGYHVNPDQPLPFMAIASQKNFIALYHMGIYTFPDVLNWFQAEYPKYMNTKLDMGKSCIRFKKMNSIPYNLIAELCRKITMEDYIRKYELEVQKLKKK